MKRLYSLKKIVIVSLLLAVIVPVSVVLIWQINLYYALLLEKTLANEAYINRNLALGLERELERLSTLLENKSDPLSFALDADNSAALNESLMHAIIQRESAIHSVGFFASNGELIIGIERDLGIASAANLAGGALRAQMRDSLAAMQDGNEREGSPLYFGEMARVDHTPRLFSIARRVYRGDQLRGYLVAEIEPLPIWQKVRAQEPLRSVSYVLDKNGLLISDAVGNSYQPGRALTSAPVIQQLIGETEIALREISAPNQPEGLYVASTRVSATGWTVVSEINSHVVADHFVLPIAYVVGLMLLVVGVYALVAWEFIRGLFRPYEQLLQALEKMSNGDYNFSLPDSSFLEIDQFKTSFIKMVRAIQHAEERLTTLASVVEQSQHAVVLTDTRGVVEYVNPQFSSLTGFGAAQVRGKSPRLWSGWKQNKTAYRQLWKNLRKQQVWRGDLLSRRRSGEMFWSSAVVSPLFDRHGVNTHYLLIQRDITLERQLSEELSYQASHDSLTGLINRAEFDRRFQRLLESGVDRQHGHVLCYLDLDQFKVVNDCCGHQAGDELLAQVAQLLKNTIRKSDTLARLGGDEFAVLMEHCSIDEAQRCATAILRNLQEFKFLCKAHSFRIGVSIGLVEVGSHQRGASELLKYADAACYMAKDLGRNRIHVYREDDTRLTLRRNEMQWINKINAALESDLFEIYAQPIVSIDAECEAHHYELLIRMKGVDGAIAPGQFLPAAERYSVAGKIDRWMICHSFALLAQNALFLDSVGFCSINLSGQSVTEKQMLDYIVTQLARYDLPGHKICFEITETSAINNLRAAIDFIAELKSHGCRFALDDFGSGVSSFGYLKNLPVDYLKIDGMFIRDILHDAIDFATVKSINEIGHVMGKKTIAEFVESDDIKAKLETIGVDYFQGYGIGRPQRLLELIEHKTQQAVLSD